VTDLKSVWQRQHIEEKTMLTVQDLRLRSNQMRARLNLRNWALYLYSAFNIVAGLWLVANDSFPKMKAPMLLMIVAHLFVLWQVWRRFGLSKPPLETSGQNALQFHRRELERQHGAVANAALWYIAPFMPALIWELVIWYGNGATQKVFVLVVLSAILFWTCVWLLFSRHAARLTLELERLSHLRAE
jgi:multisubunit Na+/H+ antiporter MnhC subunit